MAVSQTLWFDRLTLVAGVKTPVVAPRLSQAVSIGNATGADLKVYSQDSEAADETHYLVVVDGFERPLQSVKCPFAAGQVAFWLTSSTGGLVVLIWL